MSYAKKYPLFAVQKTDMIIYNANKSHYLKQAEKTVVFP